MRWMNKLREEGLSLRLTFVVMLIISLSITILLLAITYKTNNTFQELSEVTDDYINLHEAAENLINASDYLTDEAQCYTILGDRVHLENYFDEAENVRRREHAVEIMESSLPDSEALSALKNAMKESVSLMDREYYAMLLVLIATGDTNIPNALRETELTDEDANLSYSEKMELARMMMHDDVYYDQKNMIRNHIKQCLDEIKKVTHNTQHTKEEQMGVDLLRETEFIIIQSVVLILVLLITTVLGINPLLHAVEHIKRDRELPITGAFEFRYLAKTYNKMYSVYKQSIDNLSFKASHDELTGVYNRSGYDLIRKNVDLSTSAFLLIDTDEFKKVNDRYGHDIGDKALQKVARTLKKNFREDDYVCRIGGDEFAVFMVHVSSDVMQLLEQKVNKINKDLANTNDGLPTLSVSVGVSLSSEITNPQEMFREADVALYYVKEHGRKGCRLYNREMDQAKES